jgi:hypothetical protein
MTRDTIEAQILNAASEAVLFLTDLMRGHTDYDDDGHLHLRSSTAITLLELAGYGIETSMHNNGDEELVIAVIPE